MKTSVRDFARIVWFWTQKGSWNGRQLLSSRVFDAYMQPQTPKDMPQTARTGENDDYLGIGSYGGESDHFSNEGPGIYGFNWWFNDTGRLHPDALTWPDAPKDEVMAVGAGGNCAAFIPSLNAALICARGDWGKIEGGSKDAEMNQLLIGGQVFASEGTCYAVYLPVAVTTGTLSQDSAEGIFVQRWFNPRTGKFDGPEQRVRGGRRIPIGSAPNNACDDWVVLFSRTR